MTQYSLREPRSAALELPSAEPSRPAEEGEALHAVRMRRGRALVVAGFAVAIAGVVGYCAVCFAGGVHHQMAQLLLESATPFVTTLLVIGAGTALWLVGSVMYLVGAMDADVAEDLPGMGSTDARRRDGTSD